MGHIFTMCFQYGLTSEHHEVVYDVMDDCFGIWGERIFAIELQTRNGAAAYKQSDPYACC